ncbi:craniofacial development protein 2 [Plakobranchus ocellatus]|uniref:Craniofacial development protein 2 n=1 Tax=Plakobranchus ocellatus TaxID=259542 RepID=A0AAV4A7A0_9GAST|nr:craniofacial development protein 2 [Plakobranchus ocellatus]
MSIRIRASPFNITIVQAYAPTIDHGDTDLEKFYVQIQRAIDEASTKDLIFVLRDWNSKVGEYAYKDWKGTSGHFYNSITNERGFRLFEFAKYNNLNS